MKEERSGGELFYGGFITVYSTLTAVTAVLMDTNTLGLTGDVLRPQSPLAWLNKYGNDIQSWAKHKHVVDMVQNSIRSANWCFFTVTVSDRSLFESSSSIKKKHFFDKIMMNMFAKATVMMQIIALQVAVEVISQ